MLTRRNNKRLADAHGLKESCKGVSVDTRGGTNIFCKGSVDTTIPGVNTMVQNKGRNVKKSPSQVDTSPEQVDTRDRFQGNMSTPNENRSTLESLPRKAILLSGS
ncbi:hypothetical protein Taro_046241 [Colocasia esculenta]|uniref:Uncharacterized protein n=1 Tax=Colocasia esculenta TaxID=4460 RepID=A0A843WYT4_COLES|nr:hypothetical protein [Colocasia esculenta]